MAQLDFKLPDIGEGVVEGEIVKWHVAEGDAVAEDQPLVEVMTDKATVTIPSPRAGKVVKRVGKEGDITKVHSTLVVLDLGGASATGAGSPAANAAAKEAGNEEPFFEKIPEAKTTASIASAPAAIAAPAQGNGKVLATPVTRRIAHEHNVDLRLVPGSGPSGRVTKADVLSFVSDNRAEGPHSSDARSEPGGRSRTALPAGGGGEVPHSDEIREPLRGLRKRIYEAMAKSKATIPHFTFVEEVEMTALSELRARLNARLAKAPAQGVAKLNYLPFIVKALTAALPKFPYLNASLDDASKEIVVRRDYHVGIAAATPDGLTVPVVHHADRLSVLELAAEIERLGKAARENKLKADELRGATITITSLGKEGGIFATPIIAHPQVAILGVHRIEPRPVVRDGQIVAREMMYLSLAFDHRLIDGHVGAAFAYELIRYLQEPELLLVELR